MAKRMFSILLGFPLVMALLVFGNKYVIDIAFSIIAIMSIYEFYHAFSEKAKPIKWLGYLCCAFISIIHVIPNEYILNIAILSIPTVIAILFIQLIIYDMKRNFGDISISLFGIIYIVGFSIFVPIIGGLENGKLIIWYLIFAAWGTDVFAFCIGKLIGKHKFSKISPNKSIEGCIGGILGAIIFMLVYTLYLNQFNGTNISYLYILGISILLSVISQIGDFTASSIKRYTEIKDYGNLIPGHGGMLDRIDSIIFVAPFAYVLLNGII